MNTKAIPNYEEDYTIDEEGNVYSIKFNKVKKLSPSISRGGYYQVNLFKEGKQKAFFNHTLMGLTYLDFISEDKKYIIDHIDNNKLNNRLDNLRVVTERVNLNKSKIRKYPIGVQKNGNNYQANISIDGKMQYLGTFKTIEEAEKAYNNRLKQYNLQNNIL